MTKVRHPTQLYHQFNKEFWDNKLPRYRVTFYAFPWQGCTEKSGEVYSERRLIRINRRLESNPKGLSQVLLHEMCHVRAKGHGKRWQKELMNLIEMGETWASEELKEYQEAFNWNQEMAFLKGHLEDIASEECRTEGGFSSFRTVLKYSAMDLHMEPGDLLKSAPWLPQSWENAKREVLSNLEHEIRFRRGRLLP